MVESQIRQETRSGKGAQLPPHEAVRKVNAALRRLVKHYWREIELISLAAGTPPDSSKTVAEAQLGASQFILLRVPLTQLRGLTDRQRQIALSVAVGMSNKEVGNSLSISPATVASHLRVIYRKLGVDSRPALLVRLLDFGD